MPNKLCLIVDDDPSIRTYIAALLQQWAPAETLEAEGGKRALDIMKTLGDAVDLVVSDIQMPDGDGLSFAQSLRQLLADVPVILMSGHAQPPDSFEFEFVEKPFGPEKFLRAVRKACNANDKERTAYRQGHYNNAA